jgi:cytoskeletal protein RodZ
MKDSNEQSLGALLQRKRKEKGLSIEEISKKTCIRMYYLERIEEGEFNLLPPLPYSRGFVRAFAIYIGVNADQAVSQFNTQT